MAGQPYSVRFMSGRGAGRRETFTVPDGKRAVVRHLSLLIWPAAGNSVFIYVHGIPVFYVLSQAPSEMHFEEVRWTAYEGETIETIVAGADSSYALDGFMFTDPDGRPDDADNVITPVTLGRPLPASARAA